MPRAFTDRWWHVTDHSQRADQKMRITHETTPLIITVSGSTGLVGRRLCASLRAHGHIVRRLVRRAPQASDEFEWSPRNRTVDLAAFEGCHLLVHLAGKSIAGRFTSEHKKAVLDSRVDGTETLAAACAALENPPRVISASAIGFYGDQDDAWVDERSAAGEGFLAEVCQAWEAAWSTAVHAGVHVAFARFGLILAAEGGALQSMLPAFKMGLGGKLGSGKQWMSWIAADDVIRALLHIATQQLTGPINVVAPEPATNADFTRALSNVLRRPAFLPVPKFALRAALKDGADELLLASQRVRCAVLQDTGFVFDHPQLESALHAEL